MMGIIDRIGSMLFGDQRPLRCKPGDLARVLPDKMLKPWMRELVGCIVRVTTVDNDRCWRYQGRELRVTEIVSPTLHVCHIVVGISDDLLQPLRDPNDMEVDEMIIRAGPAPKVKLPEKVS